MPGKGKGKRTKDGEDEGKIWVTMNGIEITAAYVRYYYDVQYENAALEDQTVAVTLSTLPMGWFRVGDTTMDIVDGKGSAHMKISVAPPYSAETSTIVHTVMDSHYHLPITAC